jgi:hypothetical protein
MIMQTSKNIKTLRFLIMCVGFLMITTICIVAKNKAVTSNNYAKEIIVQDSINTFIKLTDQIDNEAIKLDYPNEGKVWIIKRSLTISY